MGNNKKAIGALLLSFLLTVTSILSVPAVPVWAEDERKSGVHADISTFEKNFSLSVAQKKYAIQKIERIVAFVTDPEMCDLENYYKLALWENDHVTYDDIFWCGGYDFKYYRHQWDAYGALTDKSVCAGIAILYSNLCHAADLPCKFVRTDPRQLDHTINYIPDINGNAYYVDVTEAIYLSSEKANPFGDLVDKDFAFITKPCTDGTYEYKSKAEYDDVIEYKDEDDYEPDNSLTLMTSDIKECFKTPYTDWFKEFALHEGTTKEFVDSYKEKGSGCAGEHYASYRNYPKQFSATEKPGIWFLEDFYKNPEEIRKKILDKEFDGQLLNIFEMKDSYECADRKELQQIIDMDMEIGYFPSAENGEIVAEEKGLIKDKDYKATVTSFDKSKGEAVISIQGVGDYKGTYQQKVKLISANPMKVKAKNKTISYKELKKKSKTFKRATLFKISKAKGKLTYKCVSAKKEKKSFKKYFKINAKTGNVLVKKGLKKGTYKVKVKVKAAGNDAYKAMTKTVSLKIKVK